MEDRFVEDTLRRFSYLDQKYFKMIYLVLIAHQPFRNSVHWVEDQELRNA